MKKKIIALLVSLIAVIGVVALAACSEEDEVKIGSGSDYKILANTQTEVVFTATEDVYKPISESTSLEDYLNALQTLGVITYETTESDYGAYISSVNGNAEESANTYTTYWSICTSLITLDGVEYASTEYGYYEYDGQTLGYSNYGASSLPCIEGYTYALVYTTYYYTY